MDDEDDEDDDDDEDEDGEEDGEVGLDYLTKSGLEVSHSTIKQCLL